MIGHITGYRIKPVFPKNRLVSECDDSLCLVLTKIAFALITILQILTLTGVITTNTFAATQVTSTPEIMKQWRPHIVREAQALYGIGAPVPMIAGQIWQESGGREKVTASDLGRGLAQFMDGTTAQIARSFPELGTPDPYSGVWAIRAQVRYLGWLRQRSKGDDDCHRWAAVLKGYNAGLGYVQRAQKKSSQPGVWLGLTENINSGQSEKNFIYSRWYPRVILYKHQRRFIGWGSVVCDIENPVFDTMPFR